MKKVITSILALIVLISCSNESKTVVTYWVNSYKVECEGVGAMNCLQIQKGESLDPNAWENFYSNIEGFTYQPGYIYKLKVEEIELDASEVPEDASSLKYVLAEELEKNIDPTLKLNDIWVALAIDGNPIEVDSLTGKTPQLEFKVSEKKFYGNDGCNNLFGDLAELDSETLKFGLMAGTLMACPGDISNQFRSAMEKVRKYEVQNLNLSLQDTDGNEVLAFKKVD